MKMAVGDSVRVMFDQRKSQTDLDFFLEHSKLDGATDNPVDESLLLLLKN